MKSLPSHFFKETDGVLITSASNIKYLTGYTGFSQTERECLLLFTKNKKYLITDGRYGEAVKKFIPGFELIKTGASRFLGEKNQVLGNFSKIAIEENDLTVAEHRALSKQIKKIVGIDLSKLRVIKNNDEIKKIKEACKIADSAFEFAITQLKVGVTEKEVANALVNYFQEKADNISFHPIVAFGENSSLPHHISGRTKLRKNRIVLLDIGAWKDNYCSDLSRTVFFGKASTKFKEIHETVLEAQERAIELVKPGVNASEVDKVARDYILSKGYPNILHSVGHGIGVEVHESPYISPNSTDVLEENMVFTIEPGIYLPGYGGVRIEDIVVVKKNKTELISRSKKDIIEV